jgi:hypothetical protein
MYGGIQMRSRLEAIVAANLDRVGVEWEYEPRAYAAAGMRQWLPDFELQLTFQHALIDVKGSLGETVVDWATRLRGLQLLMAVAWESDPALVLVIAEAEEAKLVGRPRLYAGTPQGWSHAYLTLCPGCQATAVMWLTPTRPAWSRCCGEPQLERVNLFQAEF